MHKKNKNIVGYFDVSVIFRVVIFLIWIYNALTLTCLTNSLTNWSILLLSGNTSTRLPDNGVEGKTITRQRVSRKCVVFIFYFSFRCLVFNSTILSLICGISEQQRAVLEELAIVEKKWKVVEIPVVCVCWVWRGKRDWCECLYKDNKGTKFNLAFIWLLSTSKTSLNPKP